jgi:hypothetical protein
LLFTLIVLAPALVSYVHNVDTVDSVHAVAENIREVGTGGTPGTNGDPIENALDEIHRLDAESSSLGIPGWFGPRAARQLREPIVEAYEARLHTWMTAKLRPALEKKLDSIAWGTPLTDAPASPEESTPLRDGYEVVRLYATLVDPKGHIGGSWATKRLADEWLQLLPSGEVVRACAPLPCGPRTTSSAAMDVD